MVTKTRNYHKALRTIEQLPKYYGVVLYFRPNKDKFIYPKDLIILDTLERFKNSFHELIIFYRGHKRGYCCYHRLLGGYNIYDIKSEKIDKETAVAILAFYLDNGMKIWDPCFEGGDKNSTKISQKDQYENKDELLLEIKKEEDEYYSK